MSRLSAFDQGPDRGEDAGAAREAFEIATAEFAEVFSEPGRDLIKIMRAAESENQDSLAELRPFWRQAYRAYHSRHWHGSKYNKDSYKARSKLFRPKTRSAVRKNLATAAASLFSTSDAVSVKAEYEDEPQMNASAAILNELLNYRLDRTSPRGGIPWFRISMGANFDAQITGICASKEAWEYRTMTSVEDEEVEKPLVDPETGEPMMNPETGEPFLEVVVEQVTKEIILADRPMIYLDPPENIYIDLRAPWYDVAQGGGYYIRREATLVGDLRSRMKQVSARNPVEWLEVEDLALSQASREYDAHGIRQERDGKGGTDRKGESRSAAADDFQTVWVHENFMRFDGVDYHWYSLGSRTFLSKVKRTIDVYPEYFGQRPVTYGVAMIEPHVPIPSSPAASWQPLQHEMNDLANLHLDALRQSVEPIAKIKRGTNFDTKQLKNRGAPGANIQVNKMDELEFDRIPEPPAQLFAEMNHLNADFDDLSGVFSGSSVQTNRSLNETVGGMRLLSGSANALSEYDLRVWAETWVEPVLRHVTQAIQYYESDARVLAICGKRAELFQRYGVNEITDEMLSSEVAVTVNIGIGAADPMQRLQKLGAAAQLIGQGVPLFDRSVKINAEEFIGEVMGGAGYKDGARFFVYGDPNAEKPDPEKVRMDFEKLLAEMETQSRERIADKNNTTRLEDTRLKEIGDLLEATLREERADKDAANLRNEGAWNRMTTLFSKTAGSGGPVGRRSGSPARQ